LKNFNAYRKAAENAEFNDSAEEYHHSKPALPERYLATQTYRAFL